MQGVMIGHRYYFFFFSNQCTKEKEARLSSFLFFTFYIFLAFFFFYYPFIIGNKRNDEDTRRRRVNHVLRERGPPFVSRAKWEQVRKSAKAEPWECRRPFRCKIARSIPLRAATETATRLRHSAQCTPDRER